MSRKRPIWVKPVFSQEDLTLSSPEEPPKKKLSNTQLKQKLNLSKDEINSSNLLDNFAPQVIDDLAVHTKKISEIEDWLKHCEIIKKKCTGGQIAIITGPSGCGKTAAVRVVAKAMQYEIVEWVSPLDLDMISFNDENYAIKESQVDIFQRFLFQSSRYNSIFQTLEKKIVLIEDFPNVFLKNSEDFHNILQRYKSFGRAPLIFIVTDSRSRILNISYNLFSDEIKNQFQIYSISFNPVSATLMKKAVKRICSLMNQTEFSKFYKLPSQDVVDSIALTALGDIRNAVINIHFASLTGTFQIQLKSQNLSVSTKKSKSKNGKILKSVGQDETITMMHALGRVFNPKYTKENKQGNFIHSPEDITNSFSTEPKNFINFIHTNYLSHFSQIEDVLGAIDSITQSDVLTNEYRDEQIGVLGLNLAVRGVMVNNNSPISAWLPIRGPKKMKENGNYHLEAHSYGIKENFSKKLLASDYRTYAKVIMNK